MYQLSEIIDFISEQTCTDKINPDADISNETGCTGDDFEDLISAFSKKYNVDIESYRWYFHSQEEGNWNSIGGSLFKPPNERVTRIPVTPVMLLNFAEKGKWDLSYPPHVLPKRRYDILFNQVLVVLIIVFVIYRCTAD